MLIAEREIYFRFGQGSWEKCHINRRWNLYPQAYKILKESIIFIFFWLKRGKSLIKKKTQYIKDMIEGFDE
jgi:hypothetical protein